MAASTGTKVTKGIRVVFFALSLTVSMLLGLAFWHTNQAELSDLATPQFVEVYVSGSQQSASVSLSTTLQPDTFRTAGRAVTVGKEVVPKGTSCVIRGEGCWVAQGELAPTTPLSTKPGDIENSGCTDADEQLS